MGSVVKKRRKRMSKKKHRKLLRKTRHQRRNKKGLDVGPACPGPHLYPANGRASKKRLEALLGNWKYVQKTGSATSSETKR